MEEGCSSRATEGFGEMERGNESSTTKGAVEIGRACCGSRSYTQEERKADNGSVQSETAAEKEIGERQGESAERERP